MTTSSLLLAALRGTLLLGVALAAMPLLRRSSAATRRLVLVFAVAAVAVLPIATAVLPALHLAPALSSAELDTRALAAASSPDPVAPAGALEGAPVTSSPRVAPVAQSPTAPWSPPLAAILLAVWAIGAAAVLARLGVGLWRAHRLASAARLVGTERVGGRSIEIRTSAEIETPAVTGLFTAVVLLPHDADTWSEERRRVVLLHELAHVARRDCLANVIAQIACAMHWYNPLAWFAARRLRIERELAADDRVLHAGGRASTYAEHLLALATVHTDVPSGALAMAEPSQVALRVHAVLAADKPRAPLGRARLGAFAAFGTAVALTVACATPEHAVSTSASPADATAGVQRRGGTALDAIARADLTIDPAVQAMAEDETDKLIAEWKPRAAVVVVLDPQTGHVLAMTSRAADATAEVATRAYVPGSTMKPFVVAAALEEGAITAAQRFDTGNGERAYGSQILHDAQPNGVLDVRDILAVSSNVGISKIFDELGGAKLAAWTKRFHFGEAMAFALPNVATGSVRVPIEDRSYLGVGVANGEGITATPLQIAAAFAALANGGLYRVPTLVKRGDSAGERVVREDIASTVMTMLEAVVSGPRGTGKAARVDGVRIAGKTGTANLGDGEYYASFVGAAPLEHPRYVVLVGVEAPRDHGAGGQVAAPVFGRLATRLLAR
ncbi:MAG: penicillin-binding transpeptidase domain-containing protein [Kofleriaceae bacterium]